MGESFSLTFLKPVGEVLSILNEGGVPNRNCDGMGPGECGPKRKVLMGVGEEAPKRRGPGEDIGGELAPREMSESLSEGVGLRGGWRGAPPWCASWAASCCCCILKREEDSRYRKYSHVPHERKRTIDTS